MPVLNPQGLIVDRVHAIEEFHVQTKQERAEIDLSGGVDSAVVLALLVKALKPENITAVYQGINSSAASRERAYEAAGAFGVNLISIDLSSIFESLVGEMRCCIVESPRTESGNAAHLLNREILDRLEKDPTILGSLRSCLRAPIGRGFNRMLGGGIRHGTGNEDEDRWMRFYQKGGDGEVDTNPIAFLSKGEVWQLALALGVPQSILEARPSPDLWGTGETAHNDEDEIKSYLGLPKDCPYPMYSYVDFETGKYKNVGLIERVSRFLDYTATLPDGSMATGEKILLMLGVSFSPICFPQPGQVCVLMGLPGFEAGWHSLLVAAKRVEKMTRHKHNPGIPMLGNRADLVTDGILTNELPVGE